MSNRQTVMLGLHPLLEKYRHGSVVFSPHTHTHRPAPNERWLSLQVE